MPLKQQKSLCLTPWFAELQTKPYSLTYKSLDSFPVYDKNKKENSVCNPAKNDKAIFYFKRVC